MSTPPTNTFGGAIPQTSQVYMGGISNVNTIDASTGSVLLYNAGNGKWEAVNNATNTSPATTGTGDITLTASQLSAGFLNRDPDGANSDVTTPTAAAIVAASPGKPVGHTFMLYLRNTAAGAFTLSLVGGTGVTVDGDADVGQNNCKLFAIRLTNVTSGAEAVTAFSMGTLIFQ